MEPSILDFGTKPVAVLSDIHGNLEALTAVMEDIERRGIKHIINLGDTVGYGSSPLKCTDIAREKFDVNLLGNHEHATLYDDYLESHHNNIMTASILYTRSQIDKLQNNDVYWGFISTLPETLTIVSGGREIALYHGAPNVPTDNYVLPPEEFIKIMRMDAMARKISISNDEIEQNVSEIITEFFDSIDHLCLVGHTHISGILPEDHRFIYPTGEECHFGTYDSYIIPTEKAIINPGSVGFPRDENPNAAYMVLHDGKIFFFRVRYDIEATCQKITESKMYGGIEHDCLPALPSMLARLRNGF